MLLCVHLYNLHHAFVCYYNTEMCTFLLHVLSCAPRACSLSTHSLCAMTNVSAKKQDDLGWFAGVQKYFMIEKSNFSNTFGMLVADRAFHTPHTHNYLGLPNKCQDRLIKWVETKNVMRIRVESTLYSTNRGVCTRFQRVILKRADRKYWTT